MKQGKDTMHNIMGVGKEKAHKNLKKCTQLDSTGSIEIGSN